jgi:hypothetical protein
MYLNSIYKKKILYSVLINFSLYFFSLFIPCHKTGELMDFCSSGLINPINAFAIFVIQFGIIFEPDSLASFFDISVFPNFYWFVGIWLLVLSPFLLKQSWFAPTKS